MRLGKENNAWFWTETKKKYDVKLFGQGVYLAVYKARFFIRYLWIIKRAEPKTYSQEELRKMYGLPKRSWGNYFGYSEPKLPQPEIVSKMLWAKHIYDWLMK